MAARSSGVVSLVLPVLLRLRLRSLFFLSSPLLPTVRPVFPSLPTVRPVFPSLLSIVRPVFPSLPTVRPVFPSLLSPELFASCHQARYWISHFRALRALAVAQSVYSFRVTYGHYDKLATDPGSDIMSSGIAMHLQWIGTSHRVSLVDVHTSNGVEPYCKQVIILLRALVQDERVEDRWSEPHNFGTILFIINSNINSETSQSPYHLTFGDLDHIYMNLPETTDKFTCHDEYVKLLNDNLHFFCSTAKKCRDSIEFKRGPENFLAH